MSTVPVKISIATVRGYTYFYTTITNFKINFADNNIKYSDGKACNLETCKEIFKLVDEECKNYKELEFITEVEEHKQPYDRYYVSPIGGDTFVGSWYGTGGTVGVDEYEDAYTYIYIEKIGDNRYVFVKRWIRSNGSELIIESYATHNAEKGILLKEESHKTTKATGDYSYKDIQIYQELKVGKFDYMYDSDDPKIFLRKY